MSTTLTCEHCGDVIGVYEPMVVVREDEILETSRAALSPRDPVSTRHFHRACWQEATQAPTS